MQIGRRTMQNHYATNKRSRQGRCDMRERVARPTGISGSHQVRASGKLKAALPGIPCTHRPLRNNRDSLTNSRVLRKSAIVMSSISRTPFLLTWPVHACEDAKDQFDAVTAAGALKDPGEVRPDGRDADSHVRRDLLVGLALKQEPDEQAVLRRQTQLTYHAVPLPRGEVRRGRASVAAGRA